MNLKAIKPSYGDFGRVPCGAVLKDIPTDHAKKLIKGGAYAEATAEDVKAAEARKLVLRHAGTDKAIADAKGKDSLRHDGPTVAEWVSAGYPASTYPPEGYASRSTPEEVADAIAVEKADADAAASRAELEKMTNKQLQELAASEGVDLGSWRIAAGYGDEGDGGE